MPKTEPAPRNEALQTEVLLKGDKFTLQVEALKDGKLVLRASAWPENKVILPIHVAELRVRSGMVMLTRRAKVPDPEDIPPDPNSYYLSDDELDVLANGNLVEGAAPDEG